MPLPSQTHGTSTASAPTSSKPTQGIKLNTEKRVFELAPAGQQPAVLAEITLTQVLEPIFKDRKRTDESHMVDKVILSFQLAATYQDSENEFYGRRIIITTDAYPQFSDPKHKLVKICLSWANKKSFTAEEMQQWASYLQAPMFLSDGARNPESLVGSPCTLHIVHGVGKTSGRDYAAIETVMSPTPGFESLTISDDYTPYAERMRQIEERRQQRESDQAQKQGDQSQPRQKDEFRGQF
jgi:hypothetical protein